MSSAYLLIAHGSQDPNYQTALHSLAHQVKTCFHGANYPTLVETACLELAAAPLHEQIEQFAFLAVGQGFSQVALLPLFLLPGVHVMADIPEQVTLANQCLHKHDLAPLDGPIGAPLALKLLPHLGACPQLVELLAQPIAQPEMAILPQSLTNSATPTPQPLGQILLSHGSRRPGGNQPVEALAEQLGAIAAYWSVAPSLEEQIQRWVLRGCHNITVLPYMLFAGSLTAAIAQHIEQLRQQFPNVTIQLGAAIAAHPQLPAIIVNWLLC